MAAILSALWKRRKELLTCAAVFVLIALAPDELGSAFSNHSKRLLIYAVVFVSIEALIPAKAGQKKWRPDTFLDLAYSFLLLLLALPALSAASWVMNSFFVDPSSHSITRPDGQVVHRRLKVPPRQGVVELDENAFTPSYTPHEGASGKDGFVLYETTGLEARYRTFGVQVEPADGERGPRVKVVMLADRTASAELSVPDIIPMLKNTVLMAHISLQVLLCIVVVDFVGYWRHRLMHWKFLWHFHAVHHSSTRVDWLSNDRFHPVNYFVSAIVNVIVISLIFDPFVGAVSMMTRRTYGLYTHANLRISYGPLDHVLVSPLFHRWHHSAAKESIDKNFATFFSLFDTMFGSFYLPQDKRDPEVMGIHGYTMPTGFIVQLVYPFQKIAGMKV